MSQNLCAELTEIYHDIFNEGKDCDETSTKKVYNPPKIWEDPTCTGPRSFERRPVPHSGTFKWINNDDDVKHCIFGQTIKADDDNQ